MTEATMASGARVRSHLNDNQPRGILVEPSNDILCNKPNMEIVEFFREEARRVWAATSKLIGQALRLWPTKRKGRGLRITLLAVLRACIG